MGCPKLTYLSTERYDRPILKVVKNNTRTFSFSGKEDVSAYVYGFQGQEKDDEIKGEGNSINFTHRMYDPRLGRMLSIDPLGKLFPWWTPYQFAGNSPIAARDMEGAQPDVDFNYNEIEWARREALKQKSHLTTDELNLIAVKWIPATTYTQVDGFTLYDCKNCSYAMQTTHTPVLAVLKTAEQIAEEVRIKTSETIDVSTDDNGVQSDLNNEGSKEGGNPNEELLGRKLPESGEDPLRLRLKVKFDSWDTDITNIDEIKGRLQKIADALIDNPDLTISIRGNGLAPTTDVLSPDGSHTAGENSLERAKSVEKELINLGVDKSQISTRLGKQGSTKDISLVLRKE